MKKNILMRWGICLFIFTFFFSCFQIDNEKKVQPRPVVIVVNLPKPPQHPILPPNSPSPIRLSFITDVSPMVSLLNLKSLTTF